MKPLFQTQSVLRILEIGIFLLLVVYELSLMNPKNPIIIVPHVLPFIILFFLFIHALFSNIPQKNSFFILFVFFELYIYLIAVAHSLLSSYTNSRTFFATLIMPLFLYVFSYNVSCSIKSVNVLPYIVMLVAFFFSIIFFKNNSVLTVANLFEHDGSSYMVLYLLPFLLCIRNKYVILGCCTMVLAVVFLSFKRGGLVAGITAVLLYMIVRLFGIKEKYQKIKNIFFFLLGTLFLCYLIYFINSQYNNYIFLRFSMIEDDGGSGRIDIFKNVMDMIAQSSKFDLLFGHGLNSVLRDNFLGFSAHNDFLECIYDYGFFAFALYVLLYVALVKYTIQLIKIESFYAAPLAASIGLFFVNSMVSHILLYNWFFMLFALFWGYVASAEKKNLYRG